VKGRPVDVRYYPKGNFPGGNFPIVPFPRNVKLNIWEVAIWKNTLEKLSFG